MEMIFSGFADNDEPFLAFFKKHCMNYNEYTGITKLMRLPMKAWKMNFMKTAKKTNSSQEIKS